ncbi:MAG: DNA damage-inducible protein D [Prolixibacteraceae bacterium]
MNKKRNINESEFERIKKLDNDGNEYWNSREFSKAIEYSDYRNFLKVVDKAKEACSKSNMDPNDHFVEITEMIELGKGGKRELLSLKLSRYACYLIVQNADPSKEVIANGQTYFAVQTRLQEIKSSEDYNQLTTEDQKRLFLRNELKKHNTQLAEAASNAGVISTYDYAIFQNHGYKGLYGGLGAKEIHAHKDLKKSQKILDHMGSTELAANLFRATQTEEKLKRDNVNTKLDANQTHLEVGRKVRKTIKELGGTMPEDLPVTESIKKVEKSVKNSNKKIKD